MTFSVVIPVYNGAATIMRAVESVLNQSLKPLQVIVVDDGSADETVSILERRYSGEVKLIKLPVNSGSSAARNAGMDAATGAYIAFLDADDTWHPDKLAAVNRVLKENPGIAFLFHLSTLSDFVKTDVENPRVQKLGFARLLKGNFIQTPCAIVRNDTSFRFEHTMRYMEDYDLWLRIAYMHSIYFSKLRLTIFDIHVS